MRLGALLALATFASAAYAQEESGWQAIEHLDSASLAAAGWRQLSASTFTVEGGTVDHQVLITFWRGKLRGQQTVIRCVETLGVVTEADAPQTQSELCAEPVLDLRVRDLLEEPEVAEEEPETEEETEEEPVEEPVEAEPVVTDEPEVSAEDPEVEPSE
jgi:hypothetical protein